MHIGGFAKSTKVLLKKRVYSFCLELMMLLVLLLSYQPLFNLVTVQECCLLTADRRNSVVIDTPRRRVPDSVVSVGRESRRINFQS